MRGRRWAGVFGGLLCGVALGAEPSPAVTVIRAGTLIDGVSGSAKTNQVVVIRGNRVESVGGGAPPAGAKVIDLSGATVLPGMIDSHTHVFLQHEDAGQGGYDVQLLKYPLAYRAARATVAARRALEQGFTTIRDVETEGAGYGDVGIKRAIEEGHIPGPRMFVSTRAISTTGGYDLDGYAPEVVVPKGAQIVDGPVEARKAAREQLENGADWIKVYMTHRSWIDSAGNLQSQPTLTVEELKAIVDEAHGWGKKVACHAYTNPGMKRALDGGCDSIEHGLELDDAAVAQMVKQGTWLCPTLAVYYDFWPPEGTPAGKIYRKRTEVHGPSFRRAVKAGVKIAFGTDVGGFSWKEPMAKEFPYMVQLGMTPMQAIQSATVSASDLIGRNNDAGSLEPGRWADLIAVKGDPLGDVRVLESVAFVMKEGKVYKDVR